MSEGGPCKARPRAEVLREILDPNVAKNEHGWAAAEEIERLRVEIEQWRTHYQDSHREVGILNDEARELRGEIEHASERERAAFHAGFGEAAYWDLDGPPDVEASWQAYQRETTKNS